MVFIIIGTIFAVLLLFYRAKEQQKQNAEQERRAELNNATFNSQVPSSVQSAPTVHGTSGIE